MYVCVCTITVISHLMCLICKPAFGYTNELNCSIMQLFLDCSDNCFINLPTLYHTSLQCQSIILYYNCSNKASGCQGNEFLMSCCTFLIFLQERWKTQTIWIWIIMDRTTWIIWARKIYILTMFNHLTM